jgi:large subunit ribosomal protein L16
MLTQPRKTKYRKWQKGVSKGIETRAVRIVYGSFGLKAMGSKWLTANQIEAARKAITRVLRKKGKLWIRIFPHKPVTVKGGEIGMGGGKGAVSHYVFPVKPGRIIFEIDGTEEHIAQEALRKAAHKLPVKCQFVKK